MNMSVARLPIDLSVKSLKTLELVWAYHSMQTGIFILALLSSLYSLFTF